MDELIKELRARKIPQSQESLTDQLIELKHIANAVGLYDAADYITRSLSTYDGYMQIEEQV